MEEPSLRTCKNCGTGYRIRKELELCWICGLPIDEEVNLDEDCNSA